MKLWGPITLGKQPRRTLLQSVALHAIQMSIVLLVCLPGLRQATTIWAQGAATVRPDPLSLEIGTENTSTMGILVEDVTDLYGFEFEITFDPAVLEVVDADPDEEGVQIKAGDFLSPDWTLENTVDNNNGTIAYALCQMNPSPPQSGGGILATITWRGKAVGTSPIQLAHVLLAATRGVEIPASTEDGQVAVTSAQAPPANTSTPAAVPAVPPTTSLPPTSIPPTTAALEATEPPAATPTSVPPGTATSTGGPLPPPTQVPTAAPGAEGTETSVPVAIAVQPTSTPISTVTTQPMSIEGEASATPLPPTPISPPGPSGIPTGSLMYIALVCLLAATLGAWALWRRRQ